MELNKNFHKQLKAQSYKVNKMIIVLLIVY